MRKKLREQLRRRKALAALVRFSLPKSGSYRVTVLEVSEHRAKELLMQFQMEELPEPSAFWQHKNGQ